MQYGRAKVHEIYVLHLDLGEDVIETLEKFIKQKEIKNGAIRLWDT